MLRAVRDVVVPEKDENGKRNWSLPSVKLFAPRTMLNVAITNQRSFAGRTIPLAETKFIAKTFGVSLNDVVMGTTAGALRRYLREYDDLPEKPLVAAVPVSLRASGDESANNQVSMLRMTLGTDVADPVERLKVIHESSDAGKAMMSRVKTVIPSDFPMLGSPWLVSGIASLVGRSRVANVVPPFANLIISNMALNVTVQSYNGRLDYGLIACRRALPDVNDLGDYLLAEHQGLMARAQAHEKESENVKAPAHAMLESAPTTPTVTRPKGKTVRKLKLVTEAPAAPPKRAASRTRRAS
jgi:diacylglycerol O-acyltransferase